MENYNNKLNEKEESKEALDGWSGTNSIANANYIFDIKDIQGNSILDLDEEKVLNTIKEAAIKVFGEKYRDVIEDRLNNTTIVIAPQANSINTSGNGMYYIKTKRDIMNKFYTEFLQETGLKGDHVLKRIVTNVLTSHTNLLNLKVVVGDHKRNPADRDFVAAELKYYCQKDPSTPYTKKGIEKLQQICDAITELWGNKYVIDYDRVTKLEEANKEHYQRQMKTTNRDTNIVATVNSALMEQFAIDVFKNVFGDNVKINYSDIDFFYEELRRNPKDLRNPKKVTKYEKSEWIRLFAEMAPNFRPFTYEAVLRRPEFRKIITLRNAETYTVLQQENLENIMYNDPFLDQVNTKIRETFREKDAFVSPIEHVIGAYSFMKNPENTLAYMTQYIGNDDKLKYMIVLHESKAVSNEEIVHELLHVIQTQLLEVSDGAEILPSINEKGKVVMQALPVKTVVTKIGPSKDSHTYIKGNPDDYDIPEIAAAFVFDATNVPEQDDKEEKPTNKKDKHDETMIMEVFNQYLTKKVVREVEKVGVKIGSSDTSHSCGYEEIFDNIKDFLKNNEDKIIECSMSSDPEAPIKLFGRAEWRKMVRHINQYFNTVWYDELEEEEDFKEFDANRYGTKYPVR